MYRMVAEMRSTQEMSFRSILMTPIEVLAHFENGKIHPLRLKLADQEAVKMDQVILATEEKVAGV